MTERKTEIMPFAMRFQERISDKGIKIKGRYNNETQMWEWPTDPDNPSVVMSGIQPERPPTTCQKMTHVSHDRWVTDTIVDD